MVRGSSRVSRQRSGFFWISRTREREGEGEAESNDMNLFGFFCIPLCGGWVSYVGLPSIVNF
jgi:hypothetical protein